MTSSLKPFGAVIDVVYTADIEEAIKIIQSSVAISLDKKQIHLCADEKELDATAADDSSTSHVDTNSGTDQSCCRVLASVVMGNTVADSAQWRVTAACNQGSAPIHSCCCKPSEVLQCLYNEYSQQHMAS